ncbi:MAG: hypothetical protein OES57_10360 [Acidimicrobiia bacterium]|nr:hypothetical protein [Acidimicrobiia bacterium]
MHREGWVGAIGAAVVVLALSGALVLTDVRHAADERPPVEVLGRVERAPLAPAAVAEPVVVEPTPTTTVSAPTTTAVRTTVPPAVPPTVTSPPAPVASTAETSPEDRARQAIAEIGYPWPSRFPSWTIDVAGSRSGVRALTYPDQRRVSLFVRPDDTVDDLRRILAHELGHVADLELNDEADRQRWRAARGVGDGVPWWPDGTSFDFDTLAGDFAEGFAAWLEGSSSQSRVGGPLTADQLALMAELVG